MSARGKGRSTRGGAHARDIQQTMRGDGARTRKGDVPAWLRIRAVRASTETVHRCTSRAAPRAPTVVADSVPGAGMPTTCAA